MKSDLIKQRQEMKKELMDEAEYIRELAMSFYMTGNEFVAERLKHTAFVLNKAAKESSRFESEELNERLKDMNESAGAILSACLNNVADDK